MNKQYYVMKKLLVLALMCIMSVTLWAGDKKGSFTAGDKTFLLNGEPFIVKAAEIHYPRIPREYWDHRIKMCKALGMNTVCIYIFWNIHEQKEGQFDFSDNLDIAEFCRVAQKNGLYVIVRPGPYVCAEWEMGGLPWWLLKKKDIRLREQDPYFMERVGIFEQKVAEQLAPLTIQNGGPIIMIQVENEYGSYGKDKPYVSAIRDELRKNYGNEITLFQCDWNSNFQDNALDDLLWTMNFGTGSNIDDQFRTLKKLRPNTPLMCSEFWSGWFDKWGGKHETRSAKDMVSGLKEMLEKNISFSLYMTHGGTSFGHWAGANSPGFAPDVTSYDYDAPINEYGQVTDKYWELRTMLQGFTDKKLPAPPAAKPIISIPEFEFTEFSPIYNGIDYEVHMQGDGLLHKDHIVGAPKTFEEVGFGWGSMLYATRLPEIPVQSILHLDAHDYAQVFIDGAKIGTLDRRVGDKELMLPPVKSGQELQILVEAMGRINFGRAIKDYKGIVANPYITASQGGTHLDGFDNTEITWTPKQWWNTPITESYDNAVKALSRETDKKKILNEINATRLGRSLRYCRESEELIFGRGYYRAYVNINKVGDTFLDLSTWGKGMVYVNGHALGRFWNIGPQQTLYCPGCWLKKGKNEIIVLDILGPKEQKMAGLSKPIIDKLLDEEPPVHRKPGETLNLSGEAKGLEVNFPKTNGWKSAKFAIPLRGRYVCIEAIGAAGDEQACIAELYFKDETGERLSREPWKVRYADSEDIKTGNHAADKIYDLQESTYWSTEKGAKFPHYIVIDLGKVRNLTEFEYLPRMESTVPGAIGKFVIRAKETDFKY